MHYELPQLSSFSTLNDTLEAVSEKHMLDPLCHSPQPDWSAWSIGGPEAPKHIMFEGGKKTEWKWWIKEAFLMHSQI